MAPPFRALLYRYVFFDWLFKDMARPMNVFERAAAGSHNRAQSRWLPLYMRRYAVGGAGLFGAGMVAEALIGPLASALFYVPSIMSVPMIAVASVAWGGLQALD